MGMQSASTARGSTALQRFLKLPKVVEVTGLSKSTIYEKIAEGTFPKPVKLLDDSKSVAWIEAEVAEWQAQRIATRDAAQAA